LEHVIRKLGDPVLRMRARPVLKIGKGTRQLLDSMASAMYKAHGVGLAAPQVGVSKRLVVIDCGDGLIELINPEIIAAEGSEVGIEGCLSCPGVYGEVERSASVKVAALDRFGKKIWVDGEGLLSRALQHEIDHLDGILFLDKARRLLEPSEVEEMERREEGSI